MNFVTYKQWNQLPESANDLFAENERISLFLSRTWLENLSTHSLKEDQSLLLVCVLEVDHMLAILPMLECSQGSLSALSNRFTTLHSLLISKDGPKHDILACLANGLSHMRAQPIRFEPIDKEDDNMTQLGNVIQANGFHSQSFLRFYNWTHPVNGQSFEDYMAQRPANLRNTIKRKQSKLEREHDTDIQLYTDTNIDQALRDYHAIYKASWKAGELFAGFTPALVQKFSEKGWLRLGILYIDQQAVAAQIWFVVHGKASIYRLAYDGNWKHYSPGTILTKFLMQHVIDTDKVSEIDFLTGNERYKQDWMTVRKERIGLVFAKPNKQSNIFSRAIQSVMKIFASKQTDPKSV